MGVLAPRHVEHRGDHLLDPGVLHVGDQPHDLDPERIGPSDGHEFAHGVLSQKELLRERLVHHRDLRRAPVIRRCELAARHQTYAQRLEVVRADLVVSRTVVHVRARGETLHVHVGAPVVPREKRDPRAGDAVHAGDGGQRFLDAVVQ